jgi:rare lipoprotein A
MNNKILIPTVLLLLSGCTTNRPPAPVTMGTGSGSAGSGHLSVNSPTTATAEIISPTVLKPALKNERFSTTNKTPNLAAITAPNDNLMPVKPIPALEESDLSKKSFDLDEAQTQKTQVLNKPAANRYSNSKNKSIRPAVPAASSAGNPSRYVVSGEDYKVLPFSNGFVEKGIASWYGPDFHGEKTSNGEIYDMYAMTAAHKRLPIPSYVKVTNLKNKRSVVLRINDRGPFFADRVIDLSYAAAQKLDIHQPGTEMVQIEAIKTSHKESVYLQLGVFANHSNAEQLQKKIVENKMPEPQVKEVTINGKPAYRVQLGPIFSIAKVNELNAKLAKMGISETWYVTENKIN